LPPNNQIQRTGIVRRFATVKSGDTLGQDGVRFMTQKIPAADHYVGSKTGERIVLDLPPATADSSAEDAKIVPCKKEER